jgi:hypothetical protein
MGKQENKIPPKDWREPHDEKLEDIANFFAAAIAKSTTVSLMKSNTSEIVFESGL